MAHDSAGRQNNGMNPTEVAALIQRAMPDAQIEVLSADNTHFTARVISDTFGNLRSLARHQQVYAALGALVGREIHALSIEAHTCAEWAAMRITRTGS
jgi:acid stress-induced BolA-like protein IbaG/YrbA